MTEGGCLCGTVRWRIEPPYDRMTHCHCSMCRKAHAAPFATYISLPQAGYALLEGEDAITYYEPAPGFSRAFCANCGSVVPSTESGPLVYAPAGCLDEDPGERASRHIFVGSKAPWHAIADELPQFEAFPGDDEHEVLERPDRRSGKPGVVAGSCLCGAVAFEVTTPFHLVHNCHCQRCRKARAAAHTTNGFTTPDGLSFTRGEELIVTYKLPEAQFFAQSFCRVCGSGLPRADASRNVAVVPFGALDDDPGLGAGRHIYAAFKAPWYEIADDLPQFDERPAD